jgi:hypothetical protein
MWRMIQQQHSICIVDKRRWIQRSKLKCKRERERERQRQREISCASLCLLRTRDAPRQRWNELEIAAAATAATTFRTVCIRHVVDVVVCGFARFRHLLFSSVTQSVCVYERYLFRVAAFFLVFCSVSICFCWRAQVSTVAR